MQKLHNEELHNSSSSPSIMRVTKSRRMRWAIHVASMGKINKSFVEKAQGKKPVKEPRCRWKENIKTDLKETWRKNEERS
jgi:hypothetical protein